MMHKVYLGLGSNLGSREENISKAVALIAEQVGDVIRQSDLYYSTPWGFESENSFVNAVVFVKTALEPQQLLNATQRIERQLGKRRQHATGPHRTYHDRPIDIDILLYDDLHIEEPHLRIPHPLMTERPFVMEPLRQIYEDPAHLESLIEDNNNQEHTHKLTITNQ